MRRAARIDENPDSPASKRGRNNRRRGASGEREVAQILTEAIGPTKRLLGQARDGGNDIDRGAWALEVKRRKKVAGLYDWLEQAQKKGKFGAVAVRSDGNGWLVCMQLTDFMRVAREELILEAIQ